MVICWVWEWRICPLVKPWIQEEQSDFFFFFVLSQIFGPTLYPLEDIWVCPTMAFVDLKRAALLLWVWVNSLHFSLWYFLPAPICSDGGSWSADDCVSVWQSSQEVWEENWFAFTWYQHNKFWLATVHMIAHRPLLAPNCHPVDFLFILCHRSYTCPSCLFLTEGWL